MTDESMSILIKGIHDGKYCKNLIREIPKAESKNLFKATNDKRQYTDKYEDIETPEGEQ